MSMFELRSTVRFIAGLFESVAIISAVLALAQWDFTAHEALHNYLFTSGLIIGFLINTGIFACLHRGLITLQSNLFFPYIVCARLYLCVCFVLFWIFFLLGAESIFDGRPRIEDIIYASVFLVLIAFWWWSGTVVRAYRKFVREVSGEHVLFHNVDFV